MNDKLVTQRCSFFFFYYFLPHPPTTHRISLSRHKVRAGGEDKEGCLKMDFDASSDISSELSFGYEFAQAEVMMKGMGSNGEPSEKNK